MPIKARSRSFDVRPARKFFCNQLFIKHFMDLRRCIRLCFQSLRSSSLSFVTSYHYPISTVYNFCTVTYTVLFHLPYSWMLFLKFVASKMSSVLFGEPVFHVDLSCSCCWSVAFHTSIGKLKQFYFAQSSILSFFLELRRRNVSITRVNRTLKVCVLSPKLLLFWTSLLSTSLRSFVIFSSVVIRFLDVVVDFYTRAFALLSSSAITKRLRLLSQQLALSASV